MPRATRFRLRWLVFALVLLLVLLLPFFLLGSDPDADNSFFSYSQSTTIRDEEGNIIEHYVNGMPATPQPEQPDPCGKNRNEYIAGEEDVDQTVFSISLGCWTLLERKQ